MASALAEQKDTSLLEKHLKCSICMEIFADPVTTSCGHSFCKTCLTCNIVYNDPACPLCKKPLSKTPDVNIVLRDIAEEQKKKNTPEENVDLYTGKEDEVPCDICRENKLKAVKSCLTCLASYCSTHLESHYSSERLKVHKLVAPLKDLDEDLYTGEGDEVPCDICVENKQKAVKSCLVCLASYCLTHLDNHFSTERLKGHKLVAPVKNLDERACLKHGRPLELYSRAQQQCICACCLKKDLGEAVPAEEEWGEKKVKLENTKIMLQEKIKTRETQVNEVKASMQDCKEQLENEWWDIEAVFAAVINIVEETQARALQPLKDRRQVVEKEAENIIKGLNTEITRFKTTISELEEIAALEDHILFLQRYPSLPDLDDRDLAEVELDTSLSFGTIRNTVAIMMEQIEQELEKLTSIELKRISKFTVDVKLDPATAHQRLVLSDDRKEVRDRGEDKEADDGPERFDLFGSVLGLNSLTSGKSYWEVEVNSKTGWDLGVARGDANRKGKILLNPDNGYWVTVHYEDDKYAALTAPPVRLSLKEKPQKVGVFLDYEEGLVSFYSVTAQSHIYSFTGCSFSDELFPYFSPHVKQEEKNAAPLIISTMKQCDQDVDKS